MINVAQSAKNTVALKFRTPSLKPLMPSFKIRKPESFVKLEQKLRLCKTAAQVHPQYILVIRYGTYFNIRNLFVSLPQCICVSPAVFAIHRNYFSKPH
jgi:hypothetical protein